MLPDVINRAAAVDCKAAINPTANKPVNQRACLSIKPII